MAMYNLFVNLGVPEKSLFADLPLEVLAVFELLDFLKEKLMVASFLMILDNINVFLFG